jgi:hypothetical protein
MRSKIPQIPFCAYNIRQIALSVNNLVSLGEIVKGLVPYYMLYPMPGTFE